MSGAQIGRRPPVDNFLGMSRMVGRQIGPGRQFDNQQINNRVLGCRLHQRERFPIIGHGTNDKRGRMPAGGGGVEQAGHGRVVFCHHAGQCVAYGVGAACKPHITCQLGQGGKHPQRDRVCCGHGVILHIAVAHEKTRRAVIIFEIAAASCVGIGAFKTAHPANGFVQIGGLAGALIKRNGRFGGMHQISGEAQVQPVDGFFNPSGAVHQSARGPPVYGFAEVTLKCGEGAYCQRAPVGIPKCLCGMRQSRDGHGVPIGQHFIVAFGARARIASRQQSDAGLRQPRFNVMCVFCVNGV